MRLVLGAGGRPGVGWGVARAKGELVKGEGGLRGGGRVAVKRGKGQSVVMARVGQVSMWGVGARRGKGSALALAGTEVHRSGNVKEFGRVVVVDSQLKKGWEVWFDSASQLASGVGGADLV